MTISVLDRLDEAADPLWREPIPALLPCRANDAELWFAEAPSDVELAKALCRDCPVQALCLAGALERREPWGVWGGELFLQGSVVPRKRPRGRPRKEAAAQYARELGSVPTRATDGCRGELTGLESTGRDDDEVAA